MVAFKVLFFQAPTCFGFGYFTSLLYSVVVAEGGEGGDPKRRSFSIKRALIKYFERR